MSSISIIGLISATEQESGIVLENLEKTKLKNLFTGNIGSSRIFHIISGIGKTNASHAATLLIERFQPSVIINFGIGGAYPSSNLRVGDIAIAEKEIYGDEGLWLKDGFHTANAIGIPFLKRGRRKYFNEFMLDKTLVKKALESSNPVTCNLSPQATRSPRRIRLCTDRGEKLATNVKSGIFVTVSTTTGTNKRAKELEKRFSASGGAICENMEGAAIAHICAVYGIPMLEIRGISNIVENRDKTRWDIKKAAENCQRVVIELLTSIFTDHQC